MGDDLREPKLTTVAGARGIGKTYTTKKIMEAYVSGNPYKRIKARRVLIFDVNNEFPYRTLPLSHIRAFSYHPSIEIRRILPIKPSGAKMGLDEMATALSHITDNFSNGLLLIEDLTKYVGDSYNRDIIGNLVTIRHINSDCIIHYQLKQKLSHPKILPNTNYIRVHYTSDSFENHKKNFIGHLEVLKISEVLVTYKNSFLPKDERRFFCYVSIEYHEITGDFTKEEFSEAICNYIDDNYKDVLYPLLQNRDRFGKLKFNYETAYQHAKQEMVLKYYGNPDK